ncbi:hypothetical protein VFPBJ_03018 [Purpureocillium lilacinum]|uniref:Uncharacterized protein n=1 Tax=Purpureocillium lilacinum TaxID=33203 RepID=A0A179H3U6_PURLI|nr:hypothetical protein VFPBJ_03018 [Purpureocillium lilacinum]
MLTLVRCRCRFSSRCTKYCRLSRARAAAAPSAQPTARKGGPRRRSPAVTCPAPLLCGLDAPCCPRPSTCAVSGDRVPPAEETKREAHTATLIAQETIRPLIRLPCSRWPLCRQGFVAARPVRPDHDTFVRPRRSRPFAHVLSLLKNDASLIRRRDRLARLGVCSGGAGGTSPGALRWGFSEQGRRGRGCGKDAKIVDSTGVVSAGGRPPDAMPKRGRGRHPTTWRGVAVSVVDRHLQTMALLVSVLACAFDPRARGPSQDGMAHHIPSTITSVSPSCPRLAPPKELPPARTRLSRTHIAITKSLYRECDAPSAGAKYCRLGGSSWPGG